jgi:sensor histidine kinase YesM
MFSAVEQTYPSIRRRMLVKLIRLVKYCTTKKVHYMEQLHDKWLRITGLFVLNAILLLFIYPDMYILLNYPFWKIALLSIVYTWLTWELTRFIIIKVRRRYPGMQNIRRRNILLPLILIPAVAVMSVVKVYLTYVTNYYGAQSNISVYSYLYAFGMNIIYTIVITGVYEVQYYLEQWKKTFAEAQELKKENLQSQLEQLKSQVKPHFLFNSLNSLLALVDEDQTRAKRFIEELSYVYRYLLQCNDKELVQVDCELDFINAFFFLLKTRFEKGLTLTVEVDEEMRERMIPPLTLQMLVENAVKHNMIAASRPLHIKIYTDEEGKLIVTNNRQKKTISVQSSKIGLSNISAKYKLLNQQDIIINETEQEFTVLIPLIKNEAA